MWPINIAIVREAQPLRLQGPLVPVDLVVLVNIVDFEPFCEK